MKLTYDIEVDAAYFQIAGSIAPGAAVLQVRVPARDAVAGDIIMDFDAEGTLLGIEILNAASVLPTEVLPAGAPARHQRGTSAP